MIVAFASSGLLSDAIIALFGSGGILAAAFTIFRWRGETATAAVAQAQGAAEALQEALQEMRTDRDEWRRRFEECNTSYRHLLDEVRRSRY